MSPFIVVNLYLFSLSLISVYSRDTVFAHLQNSAQSFTHPHALRPSSSSSALPRVSPSSSSSSLARAWSQSVSANGDGHSSLPWAVTVHNRTIKATKRSSRFADFTDDDTWIPIADESAPFLSPMEGAMAPGPGGPPGLPGPSSGGPPGPGGMSFPLFTPNVGPGDFGPLRGPGHRPRSPFPLLDYDRPVSRSPFPSYYDSPKDRGSLSPPGQISPPAPPPPPMSSPGQPPRYSAHGSSPQDRRFRPDRSKPSSYGPYGPSGQGPGSGSGPGPGSPGKGGRKGSSSGDNMYGPSDPYYDYDGNGGGGPPTYSYNPSEVPRCAKESNVSYCTEDPEYPM